MDTILIAVIAVALTFNFINGFHDTANAIATSVYTRALEPNRAILLAAVMNFLGTLVSEKVAMTISSGIVNIQLEQLVVVPAAIEPIGGFGWRQRKRHAVVHRCDLPVRLRGDDRACAVG